MELRTQHVFYSFEPLDSQKPSGSDIGKDLSRRLFDTVFVSTDKDRVFRLNNRSPAEISLSETSLRRRMRIWISEK